MSGEKPDDDYPFWQKVDRLEDPSLLLKDAERQKYAKKTAREIIAKGLKELLEVFEDIALVNAIKEGEKTELVPEEQIFEILERIS